MKVTTAFVKSALPSTVLAAVVTLSLGWPSHVTAEGEEAQAAQQQTAVAKMAAAPENVALATNESKIGDLVVDATLVPSEGKSHLPMVRLACHNPTQGRISGRILVALTRTSGIPMERVMPTPQIAWRHPETVTVEPGADLVREIEMPKAIAGEVARIDRLRVLAENSENAKYPNVYYGVTADAIEPQQPKSRARNVMAMSRSKMRQVYMADGPLAAF